MTKRDKLNGAISSFYSRMLRLNFRHLPRLPQTCSVMSAVLLRQTGMLLNHKLMPNDYLGSI